MESGIGVGIEKGDGIMSKPFRNLVGSISPERKKKIDSRTNELLREMEIRELRRALDITQEELAVALEMKQSAISRIEHQSDMFISTLRSILSAMGATLKIVASFPEGDIQINQFEDVRKDQVSPTVK